MQRYIAASMADEYLHKERYDFAKKFFDSIGEDSLGDTCCV